MRIGFLLPANFAIDNPGNGVRVQAERQAEALRTIGHDVLYLNSWERHDLSRLDVIQFFVGGGANRGIEGVLASYSGLPVLAPIIDSNEPFWRYRLASQVGNLIGSVFTVPALLRRQADFARAVIVRSEHERDRVVRGLGVDPAKVRIVLNGVSPPAPADPGLAHEMLGSDAPFILHVSAFTQPRKNVLRLAQAAHAEGLPLVIAGRRTPGSILDELKSLAAADPQIRLLDWVEGATLQSLYAACRVFALPSIHEGTGLVALEAAVHGAKIVITKHGGPPDYFRDLAWYVDPADIDDIRMGIRAAWDAPDEDQRLRAHVLEHLTWQQSGRSLSEVYEEFG